MVYSVCGLANTNSDTESEKKGVSATSIRTRLYALPERTRMLIHDFGLPTYKESEGTMTCASVVATDNILEGKIFPPNSSVISNPERKGEVFSHTEPPTTRTSKPTINGYHQRCCCPLFQSTIGNDFISFTSLVPDKISTFHA